MPKVYGWRFHIFRGVYHNSKFSHNLVRAVIVHTSTKKPPAEAMYPKLKGEEVTKLPGMKIEAMEEFVYRIEPLGLATRIISWDYEGDREKDKLSHARNISHPVGNEVPSG